jgi:hypothetical protein
MTVRMRAKCGRRQLLIEKLVGIVLPALQLGDDHRTLRFAVGRIIEAIRHPLRFDEEHPIEHIACGRLGIRRLIDPRVPVPVPAELLDDPFHAVARNVGRALEVHVLDPVRHARQSGALILRADAVPAPDRRERRGAHFLNEHSQPVVEHFLVHARARIFDRLHHRYRTV